MFYQIDTVFYLEPNLQLTSHTGPRLSLLKKYSIKFKHQNQKICVKMFDFIVIKEEIIDSVLFSGHILILNVTPIKIK